MGIGTANPTETLEVAGNVKIVDGTQGDGKVLVSDENGVASWQEISTDAPDSITADADENITLTTSGSGKVLVNGDISIESSKGFYFGDPESDGTWRIIPDGNQLTFEYRTAGSWSNECTIVHKP
ncbi:hypothetical protein GMMP13_1750002 [Candidatus Magnetomoraceae bacterium gMMP-13]